MVGNGAGVGLARRLKARTNWRQARGGARGGALAPPQLLEQLPSPVLELGRDGRLRYANRAARGLLGLAATDRGGPLLERLVTDALRRAAIRRRLALLVAGRRATLCLRGSGPGPAARWPVWHVGALRDAHGRLVGFCAVAEPASSREPWPGRARNHPARLAPFTAVGRFQGYRGDGWEPSSGERTAERVRFLARHDPLTGLVNRQALGETLEAVLAAAAGSGDGVALFALDLEDFKRVNENHGHRVGDLLLQHAADRLRRAVAGMDTVARLGGDEFAVMLRLPQPTERTAVQIGERIAGRLRQAFAVEGQEIHCRVRLGVTWSPTHGSDAIELLQQADLALQEAKRHDAGICVFGAELNAANERRKTIERRLRKALEQGEMSLVLQPQLAIASRRLVGAEALLRWRHGQPDEIGPAVFVPIAEETGLIVELGSWVLREACRLAAGWWRRGQGPRIAVNLSPVQFWNRDLCSEVEAALAAVALPPAALELEITEGVLMRDTRSAADTLGKLNELGVAIALDDFGTGYSSLSYLKRFPIHRLKIDQTFIRDLDHDRDDRQIARAIVGLGHSLGLEVIAEGVETERHLEFLAELGCDVAQGYLFSPPVGVAAFAAMLDGRLRHHARKAKPRRHNAENRVNPAC